MRASGCDASIEDVTTIEAPGCIRGRHSCTRRKGATTLTESVFSKRAGSIAVMESTASPWNAALLTRISVIFGWFR